MNIAKRQDEEQRAAMEDYNRKHSSLTKLEGILTPKGMSLKDIKYILTGSKFQKVGRGGAFDAILEKLRNETDFGYGVEDSEALVFLGFGFVIIKPENSSRFEYINLI